MATQTRAEQELQVRQISRRCRGDMVFADEVLRNKFRDRLAHLQETRNKKALHGLYAEMQQAVGAVAATVPWCTQLDLDSAWEHNQNIVFQFLFSYKENCGADFNDIICKGPFDGREHEYACRCGQKGTYIAPHFNP